MFPKLSKVERHAFHYEVEHLRLVQSKFVLPLDCNDFVLKSLNRKWKEYKAKLKREYKKEGKIEDQVIALLMYILINGGSWFTTGSSSGNRYMLLLVELHEQFSPFLIQRDPRVMHGLDMSLWINMEGNLVRCSIG